MNVCIYGAASSSIDRKYIEAGLRLGESLAEAGHRLVFGGGNEGLMGAVAKGIHRNKGYVIGIIPEFFKTSFQEPLYEACDEKIYTKELSDRIDMMREMSEAFIITPGGIGTYHEFFDAIATRSLGRHQKKIVIYNVDGYFDPLICLMKATAEADFMKADRLEMYKVFTENQIPEMMEYLK